jgi:predicted metal-dependent phosphoesterase TrpH
MVYSDPAAPLPPRAMTLNKGRGTRKSRRALFLADREVQCGPHMVKIDCHCHTNASWDALTDARRFVRDATAAGLDAVVLTDHQTLDGVRRVRDLNPPFRVIPGVEITTRAGEVLACFVDEVPPARQSLEATIEWIHARGGLAVLPHLFAPTALDRIKAPALAHAVGLADAVEGLNARNDKAVFDDRAREIAARFGKPITACSDAHMPGRLGDAYLEIEPFDGAADFLAKLPRARPVLRRRASLWFNVYGFVVAVVVNRLRPARRLLIANK